MTDKLREAAQQALDALEHHTAIKHPQQRCYRDDAIEALREALAEPVQDITAAMVMELREKTDAPLMECKKALLETDGDMAKAEKILRDPPHRKITGGNDE